MDRDEIEKLYEQYGHWVFNRAKGILKDEETAWEAVQDVFLKVLEVGSGFRGDSSPWTWLYRITTNHCLNLIRSRNAWKRALEGLTLNELVAQEGPRESDFSDPIDRARVVQLLEGEDEMTQKIVFATYFDEMTQEAMTEVLQISRKTIYKKLKKFMERARKKL